MKVQQQSTQRNLKGSPGMSVHGKADFEGHLPKAGLALLEQVCQLPRREPVHSPCGPVRYCRHGPLSTVATCQRCRRHPRESEAEWSCHHSKRGQRVTYSQGALSEHGPCASAPSARSVCTAAVDSGEGANTNIKLWLLMVPGAISDRNRGRLLTSLKL